MRSARLDAEMPDHGDHRGDADGDPERREHRSRPPGAQPDGAHPQQIGGAAAGCARCRAAGSRGDRRRSSSTTRPSSNVTRRGARAAISRSWVISTIVRPRSCSSTSSSTMAPPVRLSRLPVGSSARTIAGSPTSARAMATRWRSPPDSSAGRWPARAASPTSSSASAACGSRCRRATPAYSRPSATFSRAVRRSMRWNCWNTNPMRRPRTAASRASRSVLTSTPSMRTVPVDGRCSAPTMLSSVDLPEPDGPTMTANSPASTVRSTPSRARTGGVPP